MECLTMVGEKILDYTLALMARQVGYLIFYNSDVKELKEKAKSLQHARESVQQRVDAAYRNGDEIYNGVCTWLEKVDEIVIRVEGHIQDDHQKRTGCSSRSFPNFWMRHQLSRKSKKMVQEIEILKKEGQFEHVSYQKAPNLIENLSSAAGEEDFGSRVETLEAIMEALRDPNVNKIGVYGIGGVGKSTLVKQDAQKAQQEFDVVVMTTITQNPEVEKIQGQIADMLRLNFSNVQSSIGRAGHLHERIKKEKNVFLILDDVWGELNGTVIGIPSPEEHTHNNKKISISSEIQQRSCKFLMTSRDRGVLSKLNSQKYFMVRLLLDIEAWKLFKEKAMLDETIGNAELLSIAHQVAEECGGLPLAVVTIASSLKTKEKSEWKVVLQELRNPTPTGAKTVLPSLNNEGLPQLQHLYVMDNDEIQCVINPLGVIHSIDLFPSGPLTGESFSKLKIIKECFRMERVVYDDEKAAGILQFPKLCSLTIRSLPLLLGFYYEGNVLGTSNALFCEKVMFPSLEKLTIDGLDKLNMIWNRLMAEDNTLNSSIHDKMKDTWHGQRADESFYNLKTLKVANCEGISKVLSFSLLNLLNNLEELEVEGCNSVEALTNLEELEVKNCSNAEVVFLLDGKDIDDKNVILTTKLKKLILSNLPNLKQDYRTVTFKNLQGLHVYDCERLSYLFPANVAKGLTQLGELHIIDCGFEEIVAKEEGQPMFVSFVFPKLTTLVIGIVPQLKRFYPGRHTVEWPALKELEIFIEGEVKVFGTKLLDSEGRHKQRNLNSLIQRPIFFIEKVFPNLESLHLNDKDDILDWLGQFSIEHFRRLNLLQLHYFYKEDSFPYWKPDQ
ncbi:hypothetical protein L6164_026263 [Bauhinia variegata]|uniref:Uncharacterized protein n=1 Tax=Bauhinia variegata TaxID=167791 RepID=A0ACB9LPK4_BAUVA|nr:hypothetical protein L6164_026263 [Bauhinia variegata]